MEEYHHILCDLLRAVFGRAAKTVECVRHVDLISPREQREYVNVKPYGLDRRARIVIATPSRCLVIRVGWICQASSRAAQGRVGVSQCDGLQIISHCDQVGIVYQVRNRLLCP